MKLEHPVPFAGRWQAKWMWNTRPALQLDTATRMVLADPTDKVAMFRRELELDAVPASVPARIWADGRFILRVNGVEVGRGPVRSDPKAAHYDIADLAPFLVEGSNVISIIARHFGTATSWWMPAPPTYSMGAGSVVFEALVGDEWLISDRSWSCAPVSPWTAVPVPGDVACLPLESFDARVYETGWDVPGFDARGWKHAFEITPFSTGGHGDPHPPSEPFGMLRPPVRTAFPGGLVHDAVLVSSSEHAGSPLGEDPVRQVLNDETCVREARGSEPFTLHRFDLGRIAAGTVRLRVTGAAEGTIIDIAASEHVDADGFLVTLGQHAGLRYVCAGDGVAGGVEDFESLDIIGTRFLHASVRVPAGAAQPNIALSIADRHRPRPDGASFECSDPLLNEIFAVGLRTVDLSALDAYVDCPTREQRAWTGDSVVHQMVDLVANPDWSMPIWHPQLATMARTDGMLHMAVASDFADDDRTFVPDWSLMWVHSVWNLYRYTGDRDVVAELLPVAERTLRWFESFLGDDGLLRDVTGWVLIDWASFYSRGCSSTLNAVWVKALEDFAEMSDWIGNAGSAAWARNRYEGVRNAFDLFWDEERGVYIDHVLGGVPQRPAAQHGGAAALWAGIVPESRINRVASVLTDRSRLIRHSFVMDPVTPTGGSTGYGYMLTGYPEPEWDVENQMVEAEPFFRFVVHDGLARAGRADLIADLCRDWKVFLDAGETTWPECWTGGTRCHGWSSTPTRDLIQHVLGITPAEPGYAAVRVVPNLGDLDWARATVPSPHGFITVEARADGTVTVDSPVPVVRD
jgi:hypothetical protein